MEETGEMSEYADDSRGEPAASRALPLVPSYLRRVCFTVFPWKHLAPSPNVFIL